VLATSEEERTLPAEGATPTVLSGVLTGCRIQRGTKGKGKPLPGVHSEQMRSLVSTMG